MGRRQPGSHLPLTQSISLRALLTGGLSLTAKTTRGEDSLPSWPFCGCAGMSSSMAARGSWMAQCFCCAPSAGDSIWKASHSWFEHCHCHPTYVQAAVSLWTHGKHFERTRGQIILHPAAVGLVPSFRVSGTVGHRPVTFLQLPRASVAPLS